MINTKLILIEGMPSTGKSTNASYIFNQLQLNRVETTWIHEVTRPHPTSYFNEACMSKEEYNNFIYKYPHVKDIIEKVTISRDKYNSIDLLELQWNYSSLFGTEALGDINKYDAWAFDLDIYEVITLEKWQRFVDKALEHIDRVNILDSSIFQYQIFTFLQKNVSYERIESFVAKLFKIIEPLNPLLIYLYREKVEDSIAFLERERGVKSLEDIWERDKDEPFYKNNPRGAEGYREFLKCYGEWASELYNSAPCLKLAIEITNSEWCKYQKDMLSFLGIQALPLPNMKLHSGVFKNELLDVQFTINDELELLDVRGNRRTLIPISQNRFNIHYLPINIKFINEDEIVIEGTQIVEKWTTVGTIYKRIS